MPEKLNEVNSADNNQLNRPYLPFVDGPQNCDLQFITVVF